MGGRSHYEIGDYEIHTKYMSSLWKFTKNSDNNTTIILF